MIDKEKIISKAHEQLNRGGAIATGIGVFAALFDEYKTHILLRRRLEKESPIYPEDLSGKWELPGGGMEIADLGEEYQSGFKNALEREIKEETGLNITMEKIVLLPAILKLSSIINRNLIDFAFVVPLSINLVDEATDEHREKVVKGEVQWISIKEIDKIEIVSERTEYLIDIAIRYIKQQF